MTLPIIQQVPDRPGEKPKVKLLPGCRGMFRIPGPQASLSWVRSGHKPRRTGLPTQHLRPCLDLSEFIPEVASVETYGSLEDLGCSPGSRCGVSPAWAGGRFMVSRRGMSRTDGHDALRGEEIHGS